MINALFSDLVGRAINKVAADVLLPKRMVRAQIDETTEGSVVTVTATYIISADGLSLIADAVCEMVKAGGGSKV